MKFKYRRYSIRQATPTLAAKIIHRPVIPFSVYGPLGSATLFGLLDMGADSTLVPEPLLKQLGIAALPTAGSFRGIGSQVVTMQMGHVEIEIKEGLEQIRWGCDVGFLPGRNVAILGRQDCLQLFDITFCGFDEEVVLQRNPFPLPT